MSKVQDSDDAGLEMLFAKSGKVVVVEYYTPTCPVCRAMAPLLDAAAEQMGDRAEFVKVNVQLHPSHAAVLGVRGVPTFAFYCGGKVLGTLVGAVHPVVLRNTVDDLVKHKTECGMSTQVSFDVDPYA